MWLGSERRAGVFKGITKKPNFSSHEELHEDRKSTRWTKLTEIARLLSVSTEAVNVEVIRTYKYQSAHLDYKLDRSANTDELYRKGQSQFYPAQGCSPSSPACFTRLSSLGSSFIPWCLRGAALGKGMLGDWTVLVRKAGRVVGMS